MKVTIAHYCKYYLGLTETWIYSQIINTKRFSPCIISKNSLNLDLFPINKIYTLESDLSKLSLYFNKIQGKLTGYYPYFYSSLKKEGPALLHSHFGFGGWEVLALKRRLKIPMVTTFYGHDLSLLPKADLLWAERYKLLFEYGDLFLVEGSHMKHCLSELGCPLDKIIIQHLGVDLGKVDFYRRKPGRNIKIKILISASFREKKGIPYAIEAFSRVKKEYSNIELTIIGDAGKEERDKTEKDKILDLIKRHSLSNSVNLLGYKPYSFFLNELKNHHIFLSPSIHSSNGDTEGGAPVSIIEASASGLPVLSSFHCDIQEVVINNKSGFLVPEKDVDGLTHKLKVLIGNSNIREEFGLEGRRHIEKEYNLDIQAERLDNIYRKVIKRLT